MSMAESAAGVLSIAESGLPAQSLAVVREEIDELTHRIADVVGETQNDFVMVAYRQLESAKEDVDRARVAVEGCRESLNSYARWILSGG